MLRVTSLLGVLFWIATLANVSQVAGAFEHPNAMLVENCNWEEIMSVGTARETVTVATPSLTNHNLAANLMCQTKIIVEDASYSLKLTVKKFDLLGPNVCTPRSERLILEFSNLSGYKNITWCGRLYAEEMKLPVGVVDVIYNTGAYGEGPGFELVFSAVTRFTCHDQSELQVTTQPKFFYSPNYPGAYKSHLFCTMYLKAREGYYIQIRSLEIEIEESMDCSYDALIINNVKYCGENAVDVVVNSSLAVVQFVSDNSKEMAGFKLEYEALLAEIVNCTEDTQPTTLRVGTVEQILVMENIKNLSWPGTVVICQVVLDTGSDDEVLAVTFPKNMNVFKEYEILILGESDPDGPGSTVITSKRGPRPQQIKGPTTIHFLRTPSCKIQFTAHLAGERAEIKIQAVDKVSLPASTMANYSFVWVNSDIVRGLNTYEMLLTAEKTEGENIEVGVYTVNPFQSDGDSDSYRIPIANHLAVYNGESTNYFDLTRGCDADLSMDKSIYSINSENITVLIRRNTSSLGFWLYYGPSTGFYPPESEEISMSKHFRSLNSQLNMENLYCTWTLSQRRQQDVRNKGWLIKLKAENNFNVDIKQNSFVVDDDNATLMRYNVETKRDIWLYSPNPISITVSIFNSEENEQPIYFEFYYEILESWNDIQQLQCQTLYLRVNKTRQYAATPNYPNFYMNTYCAWVIQKDTFDGWGSKIVIEFPDLTEFPCSEHYEFKIYTSDLNEPFTFAGEFCNVDTFSRSYQKEVVKVEFISGSEYVQPGFQFAYYTQDVTPSDNCNTNYTLSDGVQYTLHGTFPEATTSEIVCTYNLNPVSYDSVLNVQVDHIEFRQDLLTTCLANHVDIFKQEAIDGKARWKLVERLCGRRGEKESFTFGQTPLKIEVRWSQLPSFAPSFELRVIMRESPCMGVSLKATALDAFLASPNYPHFYPNNADCQWRITADDVTQVVYVEFIEFRLEAEAEEYTMCNSDYVEIYDGPSTLSRQWGSFCGTVSHKEFVSTGPDITIVFRSDWHMNYKGFRIRYYSGQASHFAELNEVEDSAGIIIGALIGGIFCLLLVAILIICLVRRKHRNRSPGTCAYINRNSREPMARGQSAHLEDSAGIIIGALIGGIFCLLLVAILIICLVRRKHRNRSPGTCAYINRNSREPMALEPSVYFVNPVIINTNVAASPPPYSGALSLHNLSGLPPYTSPGLELPAYSPKDDNEEIELPPPYSPETPGGQYTDLYEEEQTASTEPRTESLTTWLMEGEQLHSQAGEDNQGIFARGDSGYSDDIHDEEERAEVAGCTDSSRYASDNPFSDEENYTYGVNHTSTSAAHLTPLNSPTQLPLLPPYENVESATDQGHNIRGNGQRHNVPKVKIIHLGSL